MRTIFEKWLKDNYLSFQYIKDNIYFVDKKLFLLLEGEENKMIDFKFSLILNKKEYNLLDEVDFVVFLWGEKFYYSPKEKIKNPEFNLLRYIGRIEQYSYPFLGIHGKYELLNGSRDYNLWCQKALFLNIKTLGICEKNTLAGVLSFQEECKKNGINPIIGETISIKVEEQIYIGKVFVINEIGWRNLLLINADINAFNSARYICEERLLELSEGLVFIFHPAYFPYSSLKIKQYLLKFSQCYFQLDSCEYNNIETDQNFIINTNKYLKSSLKPILISDAYYLEKEDYEIKSTLNTISGERDLLANNQWFKIDDENFILLRELFEEEVDFENILTKSIESLLQVEEVCSFKIETGKFKLPQYKMTEEQNKKFKSTEDLFFSIIEEGFQEKIINKNIDLQVYSDRLEEEIKVIQKGGFESYFLILWDIVNFCQKNNILTGIGRGSAAGSLVSYLMGITKIDPIPYGLLFARFLNEGRIGKSLPDIDLDVEGLQRDKVKSYLEEKYGSNKVCSIGTYTTLMLKAALKDISRTKSLDIPFVQKISNTITDSNLEWSELFKLSLKDPLLKKFIEDNPHIVNLMELCYSQPRSASVHACAILILPSDESIFTSVPIRKTENGLMVSEWEGEFIEKSGYLKEDLLGLLQLDKFRMIINLVKDNYNEDVDIYSIPLNEPEVYKMFQKGFCGDVFQFGSKGLAPYLFQVKPENIEDLIAINALYRPGPIEGNAHNEFVELRHGEKEPVYYPGTKEITKLTYSLIIYQEQIMQICQKIGGFSLVEADDIRKAMGKKNQKALNAYKDRWFEGALGNGCPENVVQELWDKMVAFGTYAFNKSHSAAYAITGYVCQYLKWKYPLPYWITALEFANDDNLLRFISEIYKGGKIQISSPDINKSDIKFKADFQSNRILWSISKVKQCGPIAVQTIFEERSKNGEFFSLEEFLQRVEKSKVNKAVVENLILAGAFDSLENIQNPFERSKLILKYRDIASVKTGKEDWFTLIQNEQFFTEDWYWIMLQKKVSGLAFISYYDLVMNRHNWNIRNYSSVNEILNLMNPEAKRKKIVTVGFIQEIEEKESKKGPWMKILIEQNYELVWLYLWSDLYEKFAYQIKGNEGNIMIFNGRIVFDINKKENIIQAEDNFQIEILSK